MAVVQFQLEDWVTARALLKKVTPNELEQRAYLYYGTYAELYHLTGNSQKANENLDSALELVKNESEKQFLLKKKESWNL